MALAHENVKTSRRYRLHSFEPGEKLTYSAGAMSSAVDRSWAIFVARTILGVVFFVAGIYKTLGTRAPQAL